MKQKKNNELTVGNKIIKCFGEDYYSLDDNVHILLLGVNALFNGLEILRNEFSFEILVDICCVDNMHRSPEKWKHGKRFEVVYHLLELNSHQRIRVKVPIELHDEVPSVTSLWPVSDWHERECWDMFGVSFGRNHCKRLLTHDSFIGHALQRDYDKSGVEHGDKFDLNVDLENSNSITFGPCHPFTNGDFRATASFVGEIVSDCSVEIGFQHKGIEKICESLNYDKVIHLFGKMSNRFSLVNGIAWCKANEELFSIEISDKSKVLRMIFLELFRVGDHLKVMGELLVDIGTLHIGRYCLEIKNIIDQFIKSIFDNSNLTDFNCIGGLTQDLYKGWVVDCNEMIEFVLKKIDSLYKVLDRSRIVADRLAVGVVGPSDALRWGYSGPNLRACGINYDLRKAIPYYFYKDVDFNIPLGSNGNGHDRILVRMEEIKQSLRIVCQLLDYLPKGDVVPEYGDVAEVINENSVLRANGEIYSAIEASAGELGMYLLAGDKKCPYRVKIRSPHFSTLYSFSDVIIGEHLADISSVLGTLGINVSELDR